MAKPMMANLYFPVLYFPIILACCSKTHPTSPARRFLVIAYICGTVVKIW